jgi:DNA gyrase/topoisomerase IV subunit B
VTLHIRPVKLHDCRNHGIDSGAELFIVEGDSASKTVGRIRNGDCQAVLPMQGKPLNAVKASRPAVGRNELYRVLIDALGAGWDETFDLKSMRYSRVILLFDPDADGIHCGALMLMFFFRWMRPVVDAGRLQVVYPPLYRITSPRYDDVLYGWGEDHYRAVAKRLDEQQIEFNTVRYRGLASISDDTLWSTCLDPETRRIDELSAQDAEAARAAFGGAKARAAEGS